MIIKKYILFVLAILLCCNTFVIADSFYSSMGLGLTNYYVSPRAVGMGGAGFAAKDGQSVNVMNPAAVNIMGRTTISVESYMEQVNSKYEDQNAFTRNGNPSGFHFYVPVYKKFTLVAGLMAVSRAKYNVSDQQSTPFVNFQRVIQGSGGLNAGKLGLQYMINSSLAIGMQANFNFGTFNEEWKTIFEETAYIDASDEVSSHLWGSSIDFGLWVLPANWFSLGIIYQSPGKLSVEENTLLGSGFRTQTENTDLTVPQALGVGTNFKLNKFRIAADFYTRFWEQYKIQGQKVNDYENYTRFGAGIEYQDSQKALDRYTRRIAFRLGAYYAQLPYRDGFNNVAHEQFVTSGISLPFHGNSGRLDLSLEIGKRSGGSFGYDEDVIRISVGFSGSELWFLRRH